MQLSQTVVSIQNGKMQSFKPMSELVLTGNLGENWKRWEQKFHLHPFAVSNGINKPVEYKIAVLLSCIGDKALKIYNIQ